ncbi:MAG TPA: HAD family phosphatase [Candidatus Acidoferrales bacterium]|nr:HAD family phosphatase [Candidatus Acidoferrales bacterium]
MIKTVIFDMDGVLIDSIPVHFLAWKKLFAQHGEFTWEEFVPLIGVSTGDTARILKKKFNADDNDNFFEKEKDRVYLGLIGEMKLIPKTTLVLQYLKDNGLKLIVATSEPTDIAKRILQNLQVKDYFQTIVGRDQIRHPKPAPDLFIEASKQSHSKPEECLVIEDSVSGVQASKKAEMKVIGLTTTTQKALLHEADIVTDDLFETLRGIDFNTY